MNILAFFLVNEYKLKNDMYKTALLIWNYKLDSFNYLEDIIY